ncbi:DUF3823 domain-containing protein [Rhodocytophaga rosea]|uniref:DUF3823 domain-containing protein n=1 Tax=Rhodocytophaga rosea TaxID=2704465 RepID=A0A6C0GPZ6_9BACT|nr:DUF3823 domain-containing protein [Rhodocytophaga rosea]QHT69997.1 DUF3823 domain-containing protein [Rhodocytophaga rosea]
MRQIFQYILWMALGGLVASCDYDNYDPPKASLQGRIVYNGDPIEVAYNEVTFQLWEPGWQTNIPITVAVGQDGAYSALLFDATYKMIFQKGQGPFMSLTNDQTSSDTMVVNVKGSQTLDIEVMPYYMIRSPQFSASGRTVNTSGRLEQIITGTDAKTVERVSLYISKTQFVDGRTSIATKDLNGTDITDLNNVALSVEVPAITPTQNYVFARMGVKINGVEDMIFSPVQRIDLP